MARSLSFNVSIVTAAFTTADTNTSITHDLARVPLAAFVVGPDGATTSIYKGSATWTTTTISLKSSMANRAVTILLV